MKTKDRILLTSLRLFNEEGESNVTAVDIANEMDISPGNLYYHFKGKEPIIKMLFQDFEDQFTQLITMQGDQDLDIEKSWSFLFLLFEQIYRFRFFYLNIQNIFHRIPELRRRFQKLLDLYFSTTKLILLSLIAKDVLTTEEDEVTTLARQIVLTVTYWLPFNDISGKNPDPIALYHQGVLQVINLIAPHLHEDQREVYSESSRILERALENPT